jgi:hypothetical protein
MPFGTGSHLKQNGIRSNCKTPHGKNFGTAFFKFIAVPANAF